MIVFKDFNTVLPPHLVAEYKDGKVSFNDVLSVQSVRMAIAQERVATAEERKAAAAEKQAEAIEKLSVLATNLVTNLAPLVMALLDRNKP